MYNLRHFLNLSKLDIHALKLKYIEFQHPTKNVKIYEGEI